MQVIDLEKQNNALKERFKEAAGEQSWAASYEDGAQFMSEQAGDSLRQLTKQVWRLGHAFLDEVAKLAGKENSIAEVKRSKSRLPICTYPIFYRLLSKAKILSTKLGRLLPRAGT